jgi:hypothetical protein
MIAFLDPELGPPCSWAKVIPPLWQYFSRSAKATRAYVRTQRRRHPAPRSSSLQNANF